MEFRVGDVMVHKQYGYRGILYGWDASCSAGDEWIAQMHVDSLPGQPRNIVFEPMHEYQPDSAPRRHICCSATSFALLSRGDQHEMDEILVQVNLTLFMLKK